MARKLGKTASIVLVLTAAAAIGGFWWWGYSRTHITTDDAFIAGRAYTIAPRISGRVAEILVQDNQRVEKGEPLVRIDRADYGLRVAEARANLALARNEGSGSQALIEAARAGVVQAEAVLAQVVLDLGRSRSLYTTRAIPKEQLDQLETEKRVADARVAEARQKLRSAEADLGLGRNGDGDARVALRQAQLAQAELNLAYTSLVAPETGYVTRRGVEVGNYVQTGQPLMSIVNLDDIWIIANYKESQLAGVKAGQAVEFRVDMYPGRTFHGHVDSLMAGTGSAFALLPPENASGNFVKVVQRIPVKILIDRDTTAIGRDGHTLKVGMSVAPTILIDRRPGSRRGA